MSTSTQRTPFRRFASAVADFGSPLYTEERQRDVWNEASAFGFQLLMWWGMVLAAVMAWFGGRALIPYIVALLVMNAICSYLVLRYARRLGVRASAKGRLRFPRLLAFAVVFAAILSGIAYNGPPESRLFNMVSAAVTVVAALTGLVIGMWRDERRRERAAAKGEDYDLSHPGL